MRTHGALALALIVIPVVGLTACGSAAPQVSTVVRMEGLMEDEVDSLSIWVFGPARSDGIMLTCQGLLMQGIQPTDELLETLAQRTLDFGTSTSRSIELSVDSGEDRIVYVRASSESDLVGSGCEDGVEVREGETTNVEVVVYAEGT